MVFLGHLLVYAVQYVVLIAVSCVGGIYVGKMLREHKDAKKSSQS